MCILSHEISHKNTVLHILKGSLKLYAMQKQLWLLVLIYVVVGIDICIRIADDYNITLSV